MLKDILDQLSDMKTGERKICDISENLLQGIKSKIYKPLMERQTCRKYKFLSCLSQYGHNLNTG